MRIRVLGLAHNWRADAWLSEKRAGHGLRKPTHRDESAPAPRIRVLFARHARAQAPGLPVQGLAQDAFHVRGLDDPDQPSFPTQLTDFTESAYPPSAGDYSMVVKPGDEGGGQWRGDAVFLFVAVSDAGIRARRCVIRSTVCSRLGKAQAKVRPPPRAEPPC